MGEGEGIIQYISAQSQLTTPETIPTSKLTGGDDRKVDKCGYSTVCLDLRAVGL